MLSRDTTRTLSKAILTFIARRPPRLSSGPESVASIREIWTCIGTAWGLETSAWTAPRSNRTSTFRIAQAGTTLVGRAHRGVSEFYPRTPAASPQIGPNWQGSKSHVILFLVDTAWGWSRPGTACHAGGRGFESRRPRQKIPPLSNTCHPFLPAIVRELCGSSPRHGLGPRLDRRFRGLPRHVLGQARCGLPEVGLRDDVVAVEDAPGLVAKERHCHALGHTAPYQVAGGGPPAVMQPLPGELRQPAGGRPRLPPIANGLATPIVKHSGAVLASDCQPPLSKGGARGIGAPGRGPLDAPSRPA